MARACSDYDVLLVVADGDGQALAARRPDHLPTGASALRQLLRELEPHARAAGHGGTLDDWDLDFMRGQTAEPRH